MALGLSLLAAPEGHKQATAMLMLVGLVGLLATTPRGETSTHLTPGRMLILYLVAENLVGGPFYMLFLRTYGHELNSFETVATAYSLALIACAATYSLGGIRLPANLDRNCVASKRDASFITLMTLGLGSLGAYVVVLKGLSLAQLITDPFASRNAIQSSSPSGTSWLLYRLLFVSAVLAIVMYATRRRPVWLGVWLVSFLLFAVYGGRWLPISLLFVSIVLWNRLVRPIPTRWLVTLLVSMAILGVAFAGYRYFSAYGGLNASRFESTFLMQLSGDVGELSRTVALTGTNSPNARGVLTHQLYDNSVPSFIRHSQVADFPTFGNYVATIQNRPESGGLRVGPVGEILLAYGQLGVLALGVAIGILARLLDKLFDRSAVGAIWASLAGIQIIFVMVTGLGNLSSTMYFLLMALGLVHLAARSTPDLLHAVNGSPSLAARSHK